MTETDITRLWVYLSTTLDGLTITLGAYAMGFWIYRPAMQSFCNPSYCNRTGCPTLKAVDMPYATYFEGAQFVPSFWVRRRLCWRAAVSPDGNPETHIADDFWHCSDRWCSVSTVSLGYWARVRKRWRRWRQNRSQPRRYGHCRKNRRRPGVDGRLRDLNRHCRRDVGPGGDEFGAYRGLAGARLRQGHRIAWNRDRARVRA